MSSKRKNTLIALLAAAAFLVGGVLMGEPTQERLPVGVVTVGPIVVLPDEAVQEDRKPVQPVVTKDDQGS